VTTNGTTAAHYEYSPFGETIAATGEKKDAFAFRFSTKYLDAETGLYYYGYRYYHPATGTWLSRDPKAEHASINLYLICKNNTLCFLDPFGLEAFRISFNGQEYDVEGEGFKGKMDKTGGTVTYTVPYSNLGAFLEKILPSFGHYVYAFGNATFSGGAKIDAKVSPRRKSDCITNCRPISGRLKTSFQWTPLRWSITGTVKSGNASSTDVTYFSDIAIISPSQGAKAETTVNQVFYWGEELCTCYEMSGKLHVEGDITYNLSGIGAFALAAVVLPEATVWAGAGGLSKLFVETVPVGVAP
jgi:RHS repeat-associated protein